MPAAQLWVILYHSPYALSLHFLYPSIPVPTKAYVPPGKEKPSGLEWYCEAMMFQLPDGRNLTVWEAMDREKASKIVGANQVIRLPSNGTLPVKVYVSVRNARLSS